jgi:hypothetical protein
MFSLIDRLGALASAKAALSVVRRKFALCEETAVGGEIERSTTTMSKSAVEGIDPY